MGQKQDRLTVFFDGSCRVCRREIEHYRQRDTAGRLLLVDIADPEFDPAPYDRERKDFMAQLHVRDSAGVFHTGVDAFARIWEVMPQPEWHLLAAVIALPGINLLARGGYALFARLRRFLPKATPECDDGSCHLGHRRP